MEGTWLSSCSAGSRGVVLGVAVAVGAARLDAWWIRSERAAGADSAPYAWAAGLTHGATVTVTTRNCKKHETTIYILFPFPYLSANVSIHLLVCESIKYNLYRYNLAGYPLYLLSKNVGLPCLSTKSILFICKIIYPSVYKNGLSIHQRIYSTHKSIHLLI